MLNIPSSCGIRGETNTHYFLINDFGNISKLLVTSSNMNDYYYLVMINLTVKDFTILIRTIKYINDCQRFTEQCQ